jgi:hypothetical protein
MWGEWFHFTSLTSPPWSCNRWANLEITLYGARLSFSEHKIRYGAPMSYRREMKVKYNDWERQPTLGELKASKNLQLKNTESANTQHAGTQTL